MSLKNNLLFTVVVDMVAVVALLLLLLLLLIMSADLEAESADMMLCCASCGIAEVDDVKLKDCDDCDLVKYCSDKCQRDHLTEHEKACKERAAELRDEILLRRQHESTHEGDCPRFVYCLFFR